MLNYWQRLIVALDIEERARIRSVIRALAPEGVKFKIGSIAFSRFGPSLVQELQRANADVFLDLKLHDIPNTMARTAAVIARMGCWAFTVHLQAGKEALIAVKSQVHKACRRGSKRRPQIFGVTVLTSQKAAARDVLRLARLAKDAGLDGVVCSAQESATVKRRHPRLKVVTPGIRSKTGAHQDQKRVVTADYAFSQGKADYIVVGRPIIQAKNYRRAAEHILFGQ